MARWLLRQSIHLSLLQADFQYSQVPRDITRHHSAVDRLDHIYSSLQHRDLSSGQLALAHSAAEEMYGQLQHHVFGHRNH